MKKGKILTDGFQLNSKLTPIILALIFIPIAIFAGVLFRNLEDGVIRESHDAVAAGIERNAGRRETNIASVNMSTRFFLSDEELTGVLSDAVDGKVMETREMQEFYHSEIADLERLVNNNPLLYAVRVYSVTDNLQEMMPILYNRSRMQNLSWYGNGEDLEGWHFGYGDTLFSSLISRQGEELVSLITPVSDYDRGITGYIESAMTMEEMFPEIYEQNEGEWSFFANNEGTILFGNGEIPEEEKVLAEYQKAAGDEESAVLYKKLGGRNYTIARYPIRLMNGCMYSVQDITDQIRDVYQRRNIFVVIMTMVLIVTAILIDRMVRNYQKEVLSKNAEIRSLQNQINAHFIYNVLESIKMMAEIDEKYEISDAITSLGKLMRYSIRRNFENVTLAEELEYIRNYVLLINLRYDFEVILSVNIPEELMDQEILKMSLQPIVENAVIHGIEPAAADTTIYIKAWEKNGTFTIEITDSGEGMSPEDLEKLRKRIHGEIEENVGTGNGVGLKNVEDRIKLSFGGEYGMEVYSEPKKYTKVSIKLPRRVFGRVVNAESTDRGR